MSIRCRDCTAVSIGTREITMR
ncbi:hypothetical protein EYY86_02260 [Hafnia paralvei]|nr:hypothetical protein EYZ00_15510 [Hafnia paralvei]TBM06833.1 hypothetical protein EYY87_05910 [Hafnia paralvei]TBM19111.1 hypothetical protein EYY86_02260 [Hafnia paralvei]